ncbi:ribonuclease T2-like [Agyrium rufum]|nr:ribonuclease T2-like [Agyrium rufum]
MKAIVSFAASMASLSSVALAGTHTTCPASPQLSCHNTTVQTNLCCFNAPGGQLLQTQFWDTDPVSGPTNSWTIHGLWPDHCDGSFDSYCDENRQYTNLTAILQQAGQTALLSYMNTYWVSDDSTNEVFWEHEWGKHGTCISTLAPKCYTNYTPGQDWVDFAETVVMLFKSLPSYTWLSNAGITPSSSKTYTSKAILAALKSPRGVSASIQCDGNDLDEIYYFYDVRGPLSTSASFTAENPVGESNDCPSTGIKYLPKTGGSKKDKSKSRRRRNTYR